MDCIAHEVFQYVKPLTVSYEVLLMPLVVFRSSVFRVYRQARVTDRDCVAHENILHFDAIFVKKSRYMI